MTSTTAIKGMLRSDGLRLVRDRFLVGLLLYVTGLCLVARWAIPWVASELTERVSFDLTPYYPLIVSHLVIQLTPLLFGIIGGFMLLESREERVVMAQLVTPVPLSSHLGLLFGVTLVASTLNTVILGAAIGLGLPPWPGLVAAALAGAPAGIAWGLFIGTLADDKTEAFAYSKFVGAAPLLATGAYFLKEPWQWLATVHPPYWASKAYWIAEADGSSWPLWALGGLVTSTVWVILMGRWYLRAARR